MLMYLQKCQNGSDYGEQLFDLCLMQEVKGYRFDFTNKIYLNHKKRKFWEVLINLSEVTYRAGVLRSGEEHKISEMKKDYGNISLAKATAIIKIAGKIDKGYYSTTAQKLPQPDNLKKPIKRTKRKQAQETQDTQQQNPDRQMQRKSRTKRKIQTSSNAQASKKFWKGMEKEDEIIEFQVVNNQLKIIKKQGDNIRADTKKLSSFDQCLDFVHKQENSYTKLGFQPMKSSAFIEQQKMYLNPTRITTSFRSNPLSRHDNSLTNMTDNAMLLNSELLVDQGGQNVYPPNHHLGPPIDHCIKCLLAQNYKEELDPTGWIMSQKLDGVRCLWTGSEMYSRNGNKFNFPPFFTKNWPNSQLDGELFAGRGKFTGTLSAVKKTVPIPSQWAALKFLVFDTPGLKEPFKIRIKILEQQLGKVNNPFLKCHAHRPCQGFPDLFIELDKVNKVGGEGVMLRQPEAFYENKRSKNLQKVKTFHDDEAEIIGYTEGTGRCLGWVGSLRVRNGKGVQFQVGSGLNDQMRQNPPPLGAKITYKYQQFNKDSGKPRFPTFLRMYQE